MNENGRSICNWKSVLYRYLKWGKVFMMVQAGALFLPGPRMLKRAVSNKNGECRNCDTLNLKAPYQYGLCRFIVKIIQLEGWTREKKVLLFCSGNYEKTGVSVSSNSFKALISKLSPTVLSCQQKVTHGTQHPEHVAFCAIRNEQCWNPLKPIVALRSLYCSSQAVTVFFQLVLKQALCSREPRNAFIDASLVHCGYIEIDNTISKSLVSFYTEGLLTCEGWFNEVKELGITFRGKRGWSLEWPSLGKRMHLPSREKPENCGAWSSLSSRWKWLVKVTTRA